MEHTIRAVVAVEGLDAFDVQRSLLAGADGMEGTSDLSRRHTITEADSGLLSIVGGKLTTYRRMGEDAVDAAVRRRMLPASA